ncbi:variable large family protein [Borrelia persica]|uniref:variable large family protein n=1 Tax=Borrelia persica TaxID=44448 RepID=UPI000463F440|nr:variable large family protein [Borrelia persica]
MKKPLGLLMMMNLFVGCDVIAGLKTSLDENKDVLRDSAIKIIGQDPGQIIDGVGNAALKIVETVDGDIIGVAQEFGSAAISGVSQVAGSALNFVNDVTSDVVNVLKVVGGVLGDFVIESSAIKFDDKRSKIKEYFEKVEKSLTDIKSKLDSSSKSIASEPNVSGGDGVREVDGIIEKLIAAVKKLVGAVGDDNVAIGEIGNSATKASIVSDKDSVQAIISGIKEIVDLATKSGVKIEIKGDCGDKVEAKTNTSAVAALNGGQGGIGEGAGSALADVVSKTDALAMINKIKDATVTRENISSKAENNAGELITGYTNDSKGAGAKSDADLAAAVALKAMSKSGRFSVHNNDTIGSDVQKIKEAAAEAVNKVLNTLGSIISQIVKIEIDKFNKAIKK